MELEVELVFEEESGWMISVSASAHANAVLPGGDAEDVSTWVSNGRWRERAT